MSMPRPQTASGLFYQLFDFALVLEIKAMLLEFIIKFYVNYEFGNKLLRKLTIRECVNDRNKNIRHLNGKTQKLRGVEKAGHKQEKYEKEKRKAGGLIVLPDFQGKSCECRNELITIEDTVYYKWKRNCEFEMGQYFATEFQEERTAW